MDITTNYGVLTLDDPELIAFDNDYFEICYQYLYQNINTNNAYPSIDFDDFKINVGGMGIQELARINEIRLGTTTNLDQRAIIPFLNEFPVFYNFFQNLNANSQIAIKSAECIFQHNTNQDTFIEIKKVIDEWDKQRWTRDKNQSERQSGVSTLGTISETLLNIVMESYIDDINFFKNNKSDVQSYGDFVLMCLPNNLWLSVKSNFARERLLASGFTTDIIGVGFFTDAREFTSSAKIRNFQKVGFLAMYVPDIPINEEQSIANVSTFSQIENYYDESETEYFPLNINGKHFIRRLSSLKNDLSKLLEIEDIRKRVTIGF